MRGEYLYGRGTVDDKGQLYLLLAASRELARAGELPVNVRFCCDGEEESGGHSIVEFLESRRARRRRGGDLRQRDDPPRRSCVQHRDARDCVLPRRRPHRGARSALGRLRRRRAECGACADPDAGRVDRPRRHAGGAAPAGNRTADGRGARELVEPARGRRRAGGGGGARKGRRCGSGLLSADVRRAVARRQRDRERLAAPPEDGAPGRGDGERLDQAGAGAAIRRDRAGGRAAASRCGARRSATSRSSTCPRRRPVSWRRTRRRSSSASTPSSAYSGGGPRSSARAARCRSSRPSSRRTSRSIITGFGLPDSQIHSPNERLLVEYVPLGIAAARELFLAFASL